MDHEKADVQVYVTTDYEIFHLFPENRQVRARDVAKLKREMQYKNLLRYEPVKITPGGFILDGQHRLAAAEELGLPVYYIIADEDLGIEDIARMNTAIKKWRRPDYLHYWAERGLPDYVALRDFWLKHQGWMSISTAAAITQGLAASSTLAEDYRHKFNTGEYKMTDMRFATMFVAAMHDFMEHFPWAKERAFMSALSALLRHPDYNQKSMADKLSKWPGFLKRAPDKDGYLDQLENLYNYHRHGPRVVFRR